MSKFVTINIESGELRFLVIHGKQVRLWGSVPLEPGVVKDGVILDPDALGIAIDELIASKQLNRGNVIASLSAFQSVHRIIELPKMPDKLLAEAITGEARRAMPISLEQIFLSWQMISEKKEDIQRFFLLGVPKNMLNAQVQCLRQAGLNPGTINLKPLALAKMVNRSNALLMDIEQESCTIVVVADGIPAIMRSVVLNPDYPVADRAQYALQEFERTLQYYESSYLDDPLNPEIPLYLSGELAQTDEVIEVVTSGVGYPVEPLPCSLECPPEFPLAQFAVNVGLALKGGPSRAKGADDDGYFRIHSLNILPDIYRPTPPSVKRVLVATGVVVGIALIFPLYLMLDSADVEANDREAELDQVKLAIVDRQKEIKEAQQMQAAIGQIEEQTKIIKANIDSLDDLRAVNEYSYRALEQAIVGFEQVTDFPVLPSITLDMERSSIIMDVELLPYEVDKDGRLKLEIDEDGELKLLGGDENRDYYDEFAVLTGYADHLRKIKDENDLNWFSDVHIGSMAGQQATAMPGSEEELLDILQAEIPESEAELLETLEALLSGEDEGEGDFEEESEPDPGEAIRYRISMTINQNTAAQ